MKIPVFVVLLGVLSTNGLPLDTNVNVQQNSGDGATQIEVTGDNIASILEEMIKRLSVKLNMQITSNNPSSLNVEIVIDANVVVKILQEFQKESCGSGKEDTDVCKQAKIAEGLVQEKINRNGATDKQKDAELKKVLDTLQVTIQKQIEINNSGQGNSNNNNQNDEESLSTLLITIMDGIEQQKKDGNKQNPAVAAKILSSVDKAIPAITEVINKKCKTNDNNSDKKNKQNCDSLRRVLVLLENKKNRKGQYNEKEDNELSGNIRVVITIVKGGNGDGNSNNDKESLEKLLVTIAEGIEQQKKDGNKQNPAVAAKILGSVDKAIPAITEVINKKCKTNDNNSDKKNKQNCDSLRRVLVLLENKKNRKGQYNEKEDNELSGNIRIVITIIKGGNGDGNSNNDKDSLEKLLVTIAEGIEQQKKDGNKQNPDVAAKILGSVDKAIPAITEVINKKCKTNDNNSDKKNKQNCDSLRRVLVLLENKKNRKGQYNEKEDNELSGNIRIVITIIKGGNGDGNSNNDKDSLEKLLVTIAEGIEQQKKDGNKQNPDVAAKILGSVDKAIPAITEVINKKCKTNDNNSDKKNKQNCDSLRRVLVLLENKKNRKGQYNEKEDNELSGNIRIVITIIKGGNGDGNSNNDKDSLEKLLVTIAEGIEQQKKDGNKQNPDVAAKILGSVDKAIPAITEVINKKCKTNDNNSDKKNKQNCDSLRRVLVLLENKKNRKGQYNEKEDNELSGNIRIVITIIKGGNGDGNSNNDKDSLEKLLVTIAEGIEQQKKDGNKQNPDVAAKILGSVDKAIPAITEVINKKCKTNDNNSDKKNKQNCDSLRRVLVLLENKKNRKGQYNEKEDNELSGNIRIVITIIKGGNGDGNSNNDKDSLEKLLVTIAEGIEQQKKDGNKQNPDVAAKILGSVDKAIPAITEVINKKCKTNDNNSDKKNKQNCDSLRRVLVLLENKKNRKGQYNEKEDNELSGNIRIVITIIKGGNGDGNSNNDKDSLEKLLVTIAEGIEQQKKDGNKQNPDVAAKILGSVDKAIPAITEVINKKCKTNDNNSDKKNKQNCDSLRRVLVLLENKKNRKGQYNEKEDNELSGNIRIVITIIKGGNGDGNSNNDKDSLEKLLVTIAEGIEQQKKDGNKQNPAVAAKILGSVDKAIPAITEVINKKCKTNDNNSDKKNKQNCDSLRRVLVLLENKKNRKGQYNEKEDNELSGNIRIVITIIKGGNGDGNSNNDKDSLEKLLVTIAEGIEQQKKDGNKQNPDVAAKILGSVDKAIPAITEVINKKCKTNDNNSDKKNKQNCDSLRRVLVLLENKKNRKGQYNEKEDNELSGNIRIVITIIKGGNGDGNSNNDKDSLEKLLVTIAEGIEQQKKDGNKQNPAVAAKILGSVDKAIPAITEVINKKCKTNDNNSDKKNKQNCDSLRRVLVLLENKKNRKGQYNEKEDNELSGNIRIVITIIKGGNGDGNSNNDKDSLEKLLVTIAEGIEQQKKDGNKQNPDVAAKILGSVDKAIPAITEVINKKCKTNDNNSDKKNKQNCDSLRRVLVLLENKKNRKGQYNEKEDNELSGNIRIVITIIKGGNGDGNSNNDKDSLEKLLVTIAEGIEQQKKDGNKQNPAVAAKILGSVDKAIPAITEVINKKCKTNDNNSDKKNKQNCDSLRRVLVLLENKKNRKGQYNEKEDNELSGNIRIVITIIKGGNGDGNSNNDKDSLEKLLVTIAEGIEQQKKDGNKQNPDVAAKILGSVDKAIPAITEVINKKCKTNDNNSDKKNKQNCDSLRRVLVLLENKKNRKGQYNEKEDNELSGNIRIVITIIKGGNGDGNSNNDKDSLEKLLVTIAEGIEQQKKDGNKQNPDVAAKILGSVDKAIPAITEIINKKCKTNDNNSDKKNKQNCDSLRRVLVLLENKKNRKGQYNEKEDNELSGNIRIVITIIKGGNGDGNSNNDKDSLEKLLVTIAEGIEQQKKDGNKQNPDVAAKILGSVDKAIPAITEVINKKCKTNDNNSDKKNKQNCDSLRRVLVLLENKKNRKGQYNEKEDNELSGNIRIVITIIKGGNGDGNSNNDKDSLEKLLVTIAEGIEQQKKDGNKQNPAVAAKILGSVDKAIPAITEVINKKCKTNDNNSDKKNKQNCDSLRRVLVLLENKKNRKGQYNEKEDNELSGNIRIVITIVKGGNGDGNSNNDKESLEKLLVTIAEGIEQQKKDGDKQNPAVAAKILGSVDKAIPAITEVINKKCKTNDNNSDKKNKQNCDSLRRVLVLLENKKNRKGQYNEKEDNELPGNIRIVITIIKGGNGDKDNNNAGQNNLHEIPVALTTIKDLIRKQQRGDRSEETSLKLLIETKHAITIIEKYIKSNCVEGVASSNPKNNRKSCTQLKRLLISLRENQNRGGRYNESEDRRLINNIDRVNTTIRNNNTENLSQILRKISGDLKTRLFHPDALAASELNEDIRVALHKIKREKLRRCEINDDDDDDDSSGDSSDEDCTDSSEDSGENERKHDGRRREKKRCKQSKYCRELKKVDGGLEKKLREHGKIRKCDDVKLIDNIDGLLRID
ncbi:unnamed protein product [Phyllotreta striolata]|uniref:Uncharacterized protein n=1 Tax=Phyllotreta striolata TaxID=444603 RepID=A0A9N9TWI5_PHYSR|nr:unnamed protein product [Phyllotreta striolata]